jgi:hypothetical protein
MSSLEFVRLAEGVEFPLGVHVKRAGRFLASNERLPNGVLTSVIGVIPRVDPRGEVVAGEPEKREQPQRRGLGDVFPNQFPVQHERGAPNRLSQLEVLAIVGLAVLVLVFVVMLLCYVCPPEKKRGVDEAEARLLGGYQNTQFGGLYPPGYGYGFQPGYPPAFPLPNQGVIFPTVPEGQNLGGF